VQEYLWTSHSALWRYAPGRADTGDSPDPFELVPYPEPFPWPHEPDWTRAVGIRSGAAVSNGNRAGGAFRQPA
jgi:hypothetical protein